MMSEQWIQFRKQGLYVESIHTLFKAVDVPGDGNCFFHSLAKNPLSRFSNGCDGRSQYGRRLREMWNDPDKQRIVEHLYSFDKRDIPFSEYITLIESNKDRVWATELEIMLCCLAFRFNVVVFSNFPIGLVELNALKCLELHGIEASPVRDTIYIYHHIFLYPLTPSLDCNHYCVLFETENDPIQLANAYRGLQPLKLPLQDLTLDGAAFQCSHSLLTSQDYKMNDNEPRQSNLPLLDLSVPRAAHIQTTHTSTDHSTGNNGKKSIPPSPEKQKSRKRKKLASPKKGKGKQMKISCAFEKMKGQSNSSARCTMSLTKDEIKEQKAAAKLNMFIQTLTVDDDVVNQVNPPGVSYELMDANLTISAVMEAMLNEVQCRWSESTRATIPSRMYLGREERTWILRSFLLYCFLHPQIGESDFDVFLPLFQSRYNLKRKTFEGWLYKTKMKIRWVPLVAAVKIRDVVKRLEKDGVKIPGRPGPFIELDVKAMKKKYEIKDASVDVTVWKDWKTKSGKPIPEPKPGNSKKQVVCKANSQRLVIADAPKSRKHIKANNFIKTTLNDHWAKGVALNKRQLSNLLEKEMAGNAEWMKLSQKQNSRNRCIDRSIAKANYSNRKKTISQKIPTNWKELAIMGAERVRQRFSDESVDVILAADETFVRFHEDTDQALVPVGTKRVGSAYQADTKIGCTVVPTMSMLTSQLLPPVIIFTGQFGEKLMLQYKETHTKQLIMFTPSHWMTSKTTALYFHWLMMLHPGQKIGLIMDHAPQHKSDEVDTYLKQLNEEHPTGSTLILEWIDPGLTSVYQPGDIAINKDLKHYIRNAYSDHLRSMFDDKKFRPGIKATVHRDDMIRFVNDAFTTINNENKRTRTISRTFRQCGLDPYAKEEDLSVFLKHLDKLEENKVYEVMAKKKEGLELKPDRY